MHKLLSPNNLRAYEVSKYNLRFMDTEPIAGRNEITEISIRDGFGDQIFHSYIQPHNCSLDIAEHKGIKSSSLESAPHLESIYPAIKSFIYKKVIVAWNMEREIELFPDRLKCAKYLVCCMKRLSPMFGNFSVKFNNYNKVNMWDAYRAWNLNYNDDLIEHRESSDTKVLYYLWVEANKIQSNILPKKENIIYFQSENIKNYTENVF